MNRRKRRYLTLIEIMIVIALIGLIGSVVAYNLKGSLNEGKSFKTAQAKEQINDILWLEMAKGDESMEQIAGKWEDIVKSSPLAKKGDDLVRDGWGQKFVVRVEGDDFSIQSDRHDRYTQDKKSR